VIDVSSGLVAAPGEDALARAALVQRASSLIRPPGGLDRLDDVAAWLGAWQRTDTPTVERPALLLAAADHGVARRGVSAQHPGATVATIDAVRAGAATSTVLAESLGVSIRLIDVGAGRPTQDLVVADAMTPLRFESAFDEGREAVSTMTADLLILGDFGVGSTTAASALSLALHGGDPSDWVGAGSGVDADGLRRKTEAVVAAVARVGQVAPLEALRRLGGAEMAALAGALYQARRRSIPVLLDGFVTTAAAAVLECLVPGALDHTLAGHRSNEPGHARLLDVLGKPPLLDFAIGHGEGSGALLAVPIVRAAAVVVSDVATLDEWGLR
jgi:nicotinate-nucleotide--dimethylbenzimidazole phosphoribosyltransferase